jgi:hypothetical protein
MVQQNVSRPHEWSSVNSLGQSKKKTHKSFGPALGNHGGLSSKSAAAHAVVNADCPSAFGVGVPANHVDEAETGDGPSGVPGQRTHT